MLPNRAYPACELRHARAARRASSHVPARPRACLGRLGSPFGFRAPARPARTASSQCQLARPARCASSHCQLDVRAWTARTPWPHRPRRMALAASPWPHRPGRIALAASPWPHRPGHIALVASPWPHRPGRITLAASPWQTQFRWLGEFGRAVMRPGRRDQGDAARAMRPGQGG